MVADLTAARATAESVFDCTGTVTRDVQGTTDDNFNLATGVSGRPSGDDATVYTGPCMVRVNQTAANKSMQAGQEISQPGWHVRFPVAATGIRTGDIFTVDTAPPEADVASREFTIVVPEGGSMSVTRILQLVERTRTART